MKMSECTVHTPCFVVAGAAAVAAAADLRLAGLSARNKLRADDECPAWEI